MADYDYDLAVIGAGSAGLVAVYAATALDLKTVLIEKTKIGGDCTWTGCVPSKALIKAAKVAHQVRNAAHYGINVPSPQTDMKRVRQYVMDSIQTIYHHETPEVIAALGAEVILAPAQFLDAHTIRVGDRTLTANKTIIATGAKPAHPAIDGIEEVDYLTYHTIWENERLPEHLLVIGAGAVGVELAQAYSRLGAQVMIIDIDLLPEEDPDARDVLCDVFADEGIRFVKGLVRSASQQGSQITLRTESETLHGDMVLVAAGRDPNISGLSLDAAGVRYDETGILVNDRLQTSIPSIYAAGDCVAGNEHFTHVATFQAFQAFRNAFLPASSKGFTDLVPRVVFTDPEIASIGLTEAEARQRHSDVQVMHRPLELVDRAVTDNDQQGFIKLIHAKQKLLGATIVSENAGEMINEIAIALTHDLSAADLSGVMHAYPTYGFGLQHAMTDIATGTLLSGLTGRIVKTLASM